MAALTIRNLDDETKSGLRFRAARHRVSMEQEARTILKEVINAGEGSEQRSQPETNWYRSFRELVETHGGFDLEIPPRSNDMREPPTFE